MPIVSPGNPQPDVDADYPSRWTGKAVGGAELDPLMQRLWSIAEQDGVGRLL